MQKPFLLNITMVGTNRVGKTSILASMYKTLDRDLAAKGVNFRATGQCAGSMAEKQDALKDLAEEPSPRIKTVSVIKGDQTRSEYDFLVDLNPVKKDGDDLKLKFIDMPGGLYDFGKNDFSDAANDIRNSTLTIVAIHTPALMEGGHYHKLLNKPANIYEAFKAAAPDPGSSILLCAVRSEKWVNTNETSKIYDKIKAEYDDLINWARGRQIRVRATAILTLGHLEFVEFDSVETDEEIPEVYKRRLSKYEPKYCEIPLKAALWEAAVQAAEKIEKGKHVLDRIWDWLKLPSEKNNLIRLYRDFATKIGGADVREHICEIC
jgi:hypothetical protein